jgi:hypothetical protein
MDRERVISILESLANGVDPQSGASIPHGVFHTADTVRALFTATTLLRTFDIHPASGGHRKSVVLTSAGTSLERGGRCPAVPRVRWRNDDRSDCAATRSHVRCNHKSAGEAGQN